MNHNGVYSVYNTWTERTMIIYVYWCIKTTSSLYLIFIHFNVRLKRCNNSLNWYTFIILLICMNSSKSCFSCKLCCQRPFLLIGKFLDFKILWYIEVILQKWESYPPKKENHYRDATEYTKSAPSVREDFQSLGASHLVW